MPESGLVRALAGGVLRRLLAYYLSGCGDSAAALNGFFSRIAAVADGGGIAVARAAEDADTPPTTADNPLTMPLAL